MTAALASGDWTFGRGAPRGPDGLGPGRQTWADGWDRAERCPADPKGDSAPGREPWRAGALVAERPWWIRAHEQRRQVVRSLRRAGYDARKLYSREDAGWRQHGRALSPSWLYTEGPCQGLEAVDPWRRAAELARCSSSWVAQPRVTRDGAPRLLPMPQACGQHHVCPVCAARRSRELARAVRAAVADARERPCPVCSSVTACDQSCSCLGDVALVTLTHRDVPGESLHDALERFHRAWRLMMRGRRGRRLRSVLVGWYYGIEVTRGAAWWHVHAHVVVGLAAGVDVEHARRVVALAWEASSAAASEDCHGTDHWGWDPLAGCQAKGEPATAVRIRMEAGDYTGGWWREIPADDDRAIHEATKYPTPVGSLEPLHLVEFLSASHGRRWHQGGWAWRSIRADGDELADAALHEASEDADLGIPIASLSPGDCPTMDEITPGWATVIPAPAEAGIVRVAGQLEHAGAVGVVDRLPRAGPDGLPSDGLVRWHLLPDAEPVGRQWAEEGWCELEMQERTTLVPCPAEHEHAMLKLQLHPSGRVGPVHVRPVRELVPVLTMRAAEAARLVALTEACLLAE